MRVVVVGGGVAGLSAAIQLAAEGASVFLVESKDILGGRVSLQDAGDWVLDPGLHLLRRRGPFQQLLRRLRAPRVLGKRFEAAQMFAVGCDSSRTREVLASMRLVGQNAPERLVVPTGGWSSLVGRLILAARDLGVKFLIEQEVKSILLDEDGMVRAVRIAANEVECDAVVLAVSPVFAARLLATASLSTAALDACTEHRVAAIDAALLGKVMRPYSGYFDEASGVLVIDLAMPDRLPERGSVESCTLLHAVCLTKDGEEGLTAIKTFLDSRCAGWRNMVAVRRSSKSVMLHPCAPEERLKGEMYIDNGIALAGTHVITSHTLSDAAVDSGRKAAKALMNR